MQSVCAPKAPEIRAISIRALLYVCSWRWYRPQCGRGVWVPAGQSWSRPGALWWVRTWDRRSSWGPPCSWGLSAYCCQSAPATHLCRYLEREREREVHDRGDTVKAMMHDAHGCDRPFKEKRVACGPSSLYICNVSCATKLHHRRPRYVHIASHYIVLTTVCTY